MRLTSFEKVRRLTIEEVTELWRLARKGRGVTFIPRDVIIKREDNYTLAFVVPPDGDGMLLGIVKRNPGADKEDRPQLAEKLALIRAVRSYSS